MSPMTEPVKQLKSMFLAQYERKFKDIEFVDTFAIATLLDPRFKTLYLNPLAHAKALKYVSDIIKTENKKAGTTSLSTSTPSVLENGSNSLWNYHHQMVWNIIILRFLSLINT